MNNSELRQILLPMLQSRFRRSRRAGAEVGLGRAHDTRGAQGGRAAAAAGAPGPRAVILRPAASRARPATRTYLARMAGT